MGTRLFSAVVGVGIAIGCAACGGSTSSDSEVLEPGPGKADADGPPHPEAGSPDAQVVADAGVPPDASVEDASPPDAAPDALQDAIVDAFCDAAWPITKSGRVVCGPADDCVQIEVPYCWGPDGQGSCKLFPVECVDAKWKCTAGVQTTNFEPGFKCQ